MKRREGDEDERARRFLARRLELAEALCDLTRRQREAIRSEDWNGLKFILDEKDERIQEFTEAEKHLKRWAPPGEWVDRVPASKTVLSKTELTLVATQSMEEECRRSLAEKKKQTARTLRGIKRLHDGIRRFKPRRSRIPRFVDLHE